MIIDELLLISSISMDFSGWKTARMAERGDLSRFTAIMQNFQKQEKSKFETLF